MIKTRRIVFIIIGLLGAFTSLSLLIPENAFANSPISYSEYNDEYIQKRALYRGLKYCYEKSGKLKDEISYDGVDLSSYPYVLNSEKPSIFKTGGSFNVPIGFFKNSDSTETFDSLECFKKPHSTEHLMYQIALRNDRLELNLASNNVEKRTEYYKGMGFEPSLKEGQDIEDVEVAKTICYSFSFKYSGTLEGSTNKLCFESNKNGKITRIYSDGKSTKQSVSGKTLNIYFNAWYDSTFISDGNPNYSGAYICDRKNMEAFVVIEYGDFDVKTSPVGCAGIEGQYAYNINDIRDWIEVWVVDFNGRRIDFLNQIPTTITITMNENIINGGSSGGETEPEYNYSLYKQKNGYITAIEYLENLKGTAGAIAGVGPSYWAVDFNNTELYYIYMRYLTTQFDPAPNIFYETCSTENEAVNYIPIVMRNENNTKNVKWCPIDNYNNLVASVIKSNEKLTMGSDLSQKEKIKFENLVAKIRELGSLEYSRLPAYNSFTPVPDPDPVDPDPGGGGGSSDSCHTNSGSLGWIVCPVMNWLHKTLISLYNEAVEPMLQVDGRLLSNSATEEAWKIFRDIANIMFVILFLVVIISQLTGVGIDNYGIKKILPKMIVAAVLINLSYVICQLAVDISNIAGAGINGLLTDQAGNIVTSQSFGHSGVTAHVSGSFNASVMFETLLEVFMGALAVGGALGVIMTVMGSGVLSGLILPLLMGLITAFVAVLFFFALLGMRQAGVVILVVVSPVAFACYMLPNTKKLFDKWLKIFEGLLIVYPICGLLVGGSTFTSAILVSGTDSFFMWFIGMLLMVVPFFFIPTLLKGSFAAMGGIGAKISGLGKRFGKGLSAKTDKAVRSSDTYRRLDNFAGRHSISRKRRAAAVSDTAAFKKEMGARRRLSDRGNMKTRIAAIEAAEDAKATDEATSQRLSLMMSSGEGGGIRMEDGSIGAYTLDNAEKRMSQLEQKARSGELTSDEKLEVSALARGMANMKGGAGKLGRIIRNSRNANGNGANTNFMSTMGEIYARDAIVQSKMNEKDMGASVYTEHFMPGGAGVTRGSNGQLGFTQTHSSYSGTADYRGSVFGRVKSHAAGLNQGGDATTEYIESLSQEACQEIMDNQELLNSLDVDVRQQFLDYAAGRTGTIMKTDANGNQVPKWDYSSTHTGWSVTEPRAKTVQFGDGSKEMQAFGNIEASTERVAVNTERTANGIDDVNSQLQRHTRASMDAAAATLDNETLMEIATNPQAAMDDPLREAAEREAKRRVQDGKMNP